MGASGCFCGGNDVLSPCFNEGWYERPIFNDVQVYIVSGFQSQTEKAVGVAGCSLMAFGIIDGGAYKGLWGGFVSYEAADYNVFLFFLEDDVFAWLYIFYGQFLKQNAQTVG